MLINIMVKNHYTLSELLRPIELMAEMCGMRWLSPMIIYSARQQSKTTLGHISDAYRQWLQAPLEGEHADGR
ncbi:glutathione-regulated potassium-efflux system ancillary protein KefG [Proteus mirabilis]|uniref:Glutathione-regulated potassium-efflux system ancillary protein KefG n=1 Tax=Proteus mirabilis TaxID=584 RepID=A0A2X2C6U7_PROMI|nr:glutathione-regulated potassium-efflux system ancillary protein KefG [Proteus mirabilis]